MTWGAVDQHSVTSGPLGQASGDCPPPTVGRSEVVKRKTLVHAGSNEEAAWSEGMRVG